MKLLILSIFCVFASISSSFDDGSAAKVRSNDANFVMIPDGFGGMKYVNPDEEPEISPSFVPADDIVFMLFTRDNRLEHQVLWWNDLSSISASNWSPSRPTIFICHGWQSDPSTEVNPLTTAAYLNTVDANVIVVDWSIGAGSINYITSRNRVGITGDHVAAFMDILHAAGHILNFNQVTCVGKSLGAHVCGHAGKSVTRGRIHTIFGLDPAGVLFNINDPANRLAATDADYVEAIHTDTVALGIGDPIGHADFYPNGGSNMPGCPTPVCDHAASARYFAESVTSDRLWGRRCANIEAMRADSCTGPEGYSMGGYPSNHRINLRGIFRMPTNAESPFGVGYH